MVNRKSVVSGLLLLILFAWLSFAQLDTGTISGMVADQTGAAIPGASVAIKHTSFRGGSHVVRTPCQINRSGRRSGDCAISSRLFSTRCLSNYRELVQASGGKKDWIHSRYYRGS